MITLTKINQRVVVVNAEHIKMVEGTPDTIITLLNGDYFVVCESVEDVVRKTIEYQRQIHGFQVV